MRDKMKKVIGIRLSVEGFHNFPNAVAKFGENVDFLQARHRHNFNITLEVKVIHNDRDQEFILLKRNVKSYIKRRYGSPAEFGSMSCESIAEELMIQFKASMVMVDEDGENYAKITL